MYLCEESDVAGGIEWLVNVTTMFFFYSLSHFFSSIECDKTTLSFIFTESWFIYLFIYYYIENCVIDVRSWSSVGMCGRENV